MNHYNIKNHLTTITFGVDKGYSKKVSYKNTYNGNLYDSPLSNFCIYKYLLVYVDKCTLTYFRVFIKKGLALMKPEYLVYSIMLNLLELVRKRG